MFIKASESYVTKIMKVIDGKVASVLNKLHDIRVSKTAEEEEEERLRMLRQRKREGK